MAVLIKRPKGQVGDGLLLSLTSALSGLFWDLAQDEAVGGGDDEQRKAVQGDDDEKVIGQLVHRRWKEVKGHALLEPAMLRMPLHVKNDALRQEACEQRMNGRWEAFEQWGNSYARYEQ